MVFITAIGFIFIITMIVNYRQKKSRVSYEDYLVENGFGHYVEDEDGNKAVVIYATKD